jgi:hypothetical protein
MTPLERAFQIGFCVSLGFLSSHLSAEDCAPLESQQGVTTNVDTIAVNAPSGARAATTAGIAQWNNCTETGNGELPLLTLGGQGDISVQVMQAGRNQDPGGGCGVSVTNTNSSGRVTGGEITLFSHDGRGDVCDYQAETMAHELGHILGLDDSQCPGRIMGPPVDGIPRTVNGEDCQRAAGRWITREEIDVGSGGGGGGPNPCGTIVVPPGKQ